MNLTPWGWNENMKKTFVQFGEKGLSPGRIIKETRNLYTVITEAGIVQATVSGSFRYKAVMATDYPAIGDWVALRLEGENSAIEGICDRKSTISRNRPGEHKCEEQIIAVNMDKLFIVMSLDGGRGYNLRGLERYLTLAWNSGALPVVVLNKADLCDDPESYKNEAETAAPGADVVIASTFTGEGIALLEEKALAGETIAFVGPSGVGKSSIINALLGREQMKTGAVRDSDKRGHHTTTHKELIMLDWGAMLIDCPGMRELQLWADDQGLDDAFSEIQELAENCRFSDCQHESEPGCAVQEALREGALDEARYQSYLSLKKELNFLHRKQNAAAARAERLKWKKLLNTGKAKSIKQQNRQ